MSNLTSQPSDAPALALPTNAELAGPAVLPIQLGKYVLRREIGRGGMGIVYEGEDTLLERTVAIKWLQPQGAQPLALDRLLREARWAARLNHPNAVAVYDAGEHASGVFIAMELVSGASAYEHVQRQGAFGWREATQIIAEVCQGLAAAHAAGLIHRDIKPANILLVAAAGPQTSALVSGKDSLGPQPWAKLSDFGLSRSLDYSAPATVEGQVVGTPHYMSPEQIRGEPLDQRSDLYSLGATYYTLLTSKLPFERDDVIQVLFAHCSAAPPNPRDVVPDLPAGCGKIIARCLAKEPRNRYSSAALLQADLLAMLAGEQPRETAEQLAAQQLAAAVTRHDAERGTRAKRRIDWFWPVVTLVSASLLAMAVVANWPGAAAKLPPHVANSAPAPARREWPSLPPAGFHIERLWTPTQDGQIITAGEMEFTRQSADGQTLAWGTSEGELNTGRLTLFDIRRQAAIGFYTKDQEYASFSDVAFPNDDYLILALSSQVIAIERATNKATTLIELDDSSAKSIDVTADGTRLVLGVVGWQPFGRVELYDLAFDRDGPRVENRRLANREHQAPVKCVQFSPDQKLVASASDDGAVIVGDSRTGETLKKLSLPTPITELTELGYALEFAPDSQLLAAGGHRGVVLWDAGSWTRRILPEKHHRGIMALAFTSDGQFIASGTTDGVRIWNVAEGWQAGERLEGHDGNVITGMAFANDDRLLITSGFDRRIHFQNLGRLKRSSQAE